MPALTIWSPEDALLAAVAPLAAAVAAPGPALVIDIDPNGPAYPGERSLAQLVSDGPSRDDLSPARRGIAVLRNGGVGSGESRRVVAALIAAWPFVVVRAPIGDGTGPPPVVPVVPLLPSGVLPPRERPAVYQRGGWPVPAPGPGLVLPRPSPRTLAALLRGVRPAPDRWLRRWAHVWRLPWR
jgi:hypothetical protein